MGCKNYDDVTQIITPKSYNNQELNTTIMKAIIRPFPGKAAYLVLDASMGLAQNYKQSINNPKTKILWEIECAGNSAVSRKGSTILKVLILPNF